ncbi:MULTISPECIES: hypothetical protein [Paenibacillus]|uniref:hypothetical protein n=1 Tax=Paenibacillus TaxID=44249 RepID=UPI00117DFA5D|nr:MULTISPECIES: hypothetical protein [Paenibacillus]
MAGMLRCPRARKTVEMPFVSNLQIDEGTVKYVKWLKELFIKKRTINRSDRPYPVDVCPEPPKTYRKEFYIKTQYSSFSSRVTSYDRSLASLKKKKEWRGYGEAKNSNDGR